MARSESDQTTSWKFMEMMHTTRMMLTSYLINWIILPTENFSAAIFSRCVKSDFVKCPRFSNSNIRLSRVACDFQIIAIHTQETTTVEISVQKISNLNVHLPLSLTYWLCASQFQDNYEQLTNHFCRFSNWPVLSHSSELRLKQNEECARGYEQQVGRKKL